MSASWPATPPPGTEERRAELAANVGRVRSRIAAACEAAGRNRMEITLVAVTKTYPASDVLLLADLGIRDVGENRDQEGAAKAAEVAAADVAVRWHFVGQLQSNKCRSVAAYASVVHSVDRGSLARALAAAVTRRGGPALDVLVQVSLDEDPVRGGVPARDVMAVADAVAVESALRLRGVMAVPPVGVEPARAFAGLADVAQRIRVGYPAATVISAGMSGDFEAAIRYGATHVRIGSALLGARPPLG